MFSIRVCGLFWWLRSWNWWKSVKFIKIKVPKKVWGLGFDKKFARVAGICQILKIYPGVAGEGGGGLVTLGIDWYIIISHKFYIYVRCVTKTKTETMFISNIKLYKNTSKDNTFSITRSFGMVLISYDLTSFRRACALFIQCFYIQQWPATIGQLFPFMPERIRKHQ